MTGRWFPLPRATDAEMDRVLRDARFRFEHRVEIPVSPSTVWEVLTADDALTSWATGITGADWTSPLGVGATRTVTVGRVRSQASTSTTLSRSAKACAPTPWPTSPRLTASAASRVSAA